MPRVLCTLPNASEKINGVRFVSVPNGMLSEEISEERAEGFATIRGYEIVGQAVTEAANPAKGEIVEAATVAEDRTPIKRRMGRPPKQTVTEGSIPVLSTVVATDEMVTSLEEIPPAAS